MRSPMRPACAPLRFLRPAADPPIAYARLAGSEYDSYTRAPGSIVRGRLEVAVQGLFGTVCADKFGAGGCLPPLSPPLRPTPATELKPGTCAASRCNEFRPVRSSTAAPPAITRCGAAL